MAVAERSRSSASRVLFPGLCPIRIHLTIFQWKRGQREKTRIVYRATARVAPYRLPRPSSTTHHPRLPSVHRHQTNQPARTPNSTLGARTRAFRCKSVGPKVWFKEKCRNFQQPFRWIRPQPNFSSRPLSPRSSTFDCSADITDERLVIPRAACCATIPVAIAAA